MSSSPDLVPSVRYCVTAVIDLLGFASHLEVGGADVRTTIGQEAITRLQILEQAIRLMEAERQKRAQEYPIQPLFYRRINDCILLVADLPNYLLPHTGDTVRSGMTAAQFKEHFNVEDYEDDLEKFQRAVQEKTESSIGELAKFVGIVARLHSYIRLAEGAFHFPGCRTVIATGFRRPFILNGADDFLAANFSFSNAYIASERHLHGGALFVDNNIIQLLSANVFYRNILRYGSFIARATAFDVFKDHEDVFSVKRDYVRSEVIPVELFRKDYWFQEMNPRCLPHLQRVGWLDEFLRGNKPSARSLFLRVLRAIQTGPSDEELREKRCSEIPLILSKDDIEEDIQILSELMALGHSPILDALNEKKHQEDIAALLSRSP